MKHKAIRPLFNKIVSKLFYNRYLHNIKSRYYNRFIYGKTLDKVKGKGHLNILFFVQDMSMWKYEGLCELLKQDSRYDFQLIPWLLPFDSKEAQQKVDKQVEEYCSKKGYYFSRCLDIEKQTYLPAKEFNPDIVVYTQPYNSGYHYWLIEKFWKKSLFIFTPYGEVQRNNYPELLYTFLQNIAHCLFYSSPIYKDMMKGNKNAKGSNIIITGHPLYEEFKKRSSEQEFNHISKRKRVIWAPHHAVIPGDAMLRSSFLEHADQMISLTKEFPDIDFIFRPHPYLKRNLYNIWGKDKTEEYYQEWTCNNRSYSEGGSYIELFLQSDGMIHDCCGFMFDYLLVNKPVMFMYNKGMANTFSPFGLEAFNAHYIGTNIEQIRSFLDNKIRKGEDDMRGIRTQMVASQLAPPNSRTVSQNMKAELDKLF